MSNRTAQSGFSESRT